MGKAWNQVVYMYLLLPITHLPFPMSILLLYEYTEKNKREFRIFCMHILCCSMFILFAYIHSPSWRGSHHRHSSGGCWVHCPTSSGHRSALLCLPLCQERPGWRWEHHTCGPHTHPPLSVCTWLFGWWGDCRLGQAFQADNQCMTSMAHRFVGLFVASQWLHVYDSVINMYM